MQYYDRRSTSIIIHNTQSSETEQVQQLRFVQADFPKKIYTRRQIPYLLDLALAANEAEADSRLKFIYYYQIIEHAAFYFIEEGIRRDLIKIIDSPDIHSDPDKYIPQVLDTISISRQEEEAKIEKIIKISCGLDIIWNEIQQNKPYFSKKQEFNGGFELDACISEDTTFESFAAMCLPKLVNCLRYIRNALIHGSEKRSGMVISPTPANDRKIRPWLPVIRRIAEQVIIFGRMA